MTKHQSTTRGFKRTSQLLTQRIRRASESRGFAESRVLTHWAEIVGEDLAAIARPVDVSFGRGGIGATLTVLTTGAQAPMLEMQKARIRERVNAIYGYNAIARVRITQTARTGFADGQVQFDMSGAKDQGRAPDPEITRAATLYAEEVNDPGLKAALEALGRNVLSKDKR